MNKIRTKYCLKDTYRTVLRCQFQVLSTGPAVRTDVPRRFPQSRMRIKVCLCKNVPLVL
jgi:hypothetical protein